MRTKEAVPLREGSAPLELADVLDGIASLVDKSLLRQEEPLGLNGEPRFVMLQTIREFGLERLSESGEEAVARGHAAHYATLMTRSRG